MIFILLNAGLYVHANETSVRNGTFTTGKGTVLLVNATVEHEATDSSNKITFYMNKTYTLMITVTLSTLGADVLDFHDIAFNIEIKSSSLLGDDLVYYNGYFFDSQTRLQTNDSVTYSFDMALSGVEVNRDAQLKVQMLGKENVKENRDPTSSFDVLILECVVNPNDSINNVTVVGNDTLDKSMEVYADKESKIRFEVYISEDGIDNNTGKPMIQSNKFYSIKFVVTVLELGPDAKDVHDLSIRATLLDESITDIIPGNDATRYFSTGVDDTDTRFLVNTTKTYNVVFYPSTNINNTEVKLQLNFAVKENVQLLDPTSKFDLSVDFLLNGGKTNVFDSLLSSTTGLDFQFNFFLLFFLIAIPILRKKYNNN